MLNIEKYRKEIEDIGIGSIAVNEKGELKRCASVSCLSCAFYPNEEGYCDTNKTEWLCEEYEESEIDWDNDIGWERVPIDTEVEVKNDIDCEWVKAFFLAYFPNKKSYKYAAFSYGEKRDKACNADFLIYCKLVKPEDIEKYRKR